MLDWYDAHAEQYDRLETGLAGDIAFYTALARAAAPPVLELGCGTGRVTLPIARAGVPVVGLDRSPLMLDVARRKAAGVAGVRWTVADMRTFELGERFGLICIPHRTFLHLLTVDDQLAVLDRCRRHLRPGGFLSLNISNPSPALLAAVRGRGPVRGRRTSPTAPGSGARAGSAQGPIIGQPHAGLYVRYVLPDEMRGLLEQSGFGVEALYGGFDRQPFSEDSTEQVWVAKVRMTNDARLGVAASLERSSLARQRSAKVPLAAQ